MKRGILKVTLLLLALSFVLLFVGCAKRETAPQPVEIKLATTTSTADTGLLDYLVPKFEEKYNIKVKVLAKGTGEAIKLGEKGDVDVLLVHSRKDEDKFVREGFGVDRRDVMYNDFVIVGPEKDPAGIKSAKMAVEALARIFNTKSTFVARGDNSGTDKKEKTLWTEAGLSPEGNPWYLESGGGMADTLRLTGEKEAYTLSDRGTYLSLKDKIKSVILFEGDKKLFNPYGVIAVNPEKYPRAKYNEAKKFIDFLVSSEGQKLIGEYGKDKYGQQLFVPNAK